MPQHFSPGTLRFGNVTTLDILTHLWLNHGAVTQTALDDNLERMKKPWHPTTPIQVLFDQLQSTEKFAIAAGAGFGESNVVRTGYNAIKQTNLFDTACEQWRAKPIADKTFIAFKAHFLLAYNDKAATTQSAGFHSAFAAPESELQIALKEISKLKLELTKRTPPLTVPHSTQTPLTYCWTHGHSTSGRHTSKTCKNKATGHQDEATATDTMGGSTRVWTAHDAKPRA